MVARQPLRLRLGSVDVDLGCVAVFAPNSRAELLWVKGDRQRFKLTPAKGFPVLHAMDPARLPERARLAIDPEV